MIFRLVHREARHRAQLACADAPDGWIVKITEPTRSLEQNALLWPLLTELSKQVVWYGKKLSEDEWKDVTTAALKKSKVIPGIDGGFVVCGQSTSNMNKADFSELIELIYSFGAQNGVKFSNEQADK